MFKFFKKQYLAHCAADHNRVVIEAYKRFNSGDLIGCIDLIERWFCVFPLPVGSNGARLNLPRIKDYADTREIELRNCINNQRILQLMLSLAYEKIDHYEKAYFWRKNCDGFDTIEFFALDCLGAREDELIKVVMEANFEYTHADLYRVFEMSSVVLAYRTNVAQVPSDFTAHVKEYLDNGYCGSIPQNYSSKTGYARTVSSRLDLGRAEIIVEFGDETEDLVRDLSCSGMISLLDLFMRILTLKPAIATFQFKNSFIFDGYTQLKTIRSSSVI